MGARIESDRKETKMGERVHIVETYKWTSVSGERAIAGYDLSVRYSKEQKDWFNSESYELSKWLNRNSECCDLDCETNEWIVKEEGLESIPDEAFKKPPVGRTEEEMRRFVAECIRCAKMNDGECHLEWF